MVLRKQWLTRREREREREHPTSDPAPPGPAIGGESRTHSPSGSDPTAGGRDGLSTSCSVRISNAPTVAQEGLASCAARRPSVGDRLDNHPRTRGLARDRDEGKERERLGPPDQPRSLVKPHKTWSVEVEQPSQRTHGIARAADESPPYPGDDCSDTHGLACDPLV